MRPFLTDDEFSWCAEWQGRHVDAYHPGSRETCTTCQDVITYYGPMPSPALMMMYEQIIKQTSKKGYTKQAIPESLRWDIWERDNFTCRNCGSRRYLSVDHIVPEVRGGTLDPTNLQTLCRSCNSAKGAR